MLEVENENTPVEVNEKAFDEGFGIEAEVDNAKPTVEETPVVSEVSTPAETEQKEIDYTPFLETLSKEIKFMDEEVKFTNLDEVKTNIQKGLNYERLEKKLSDYENSKEMTYLKEKAKSLGLTTEQYIIEVEKYEVEQERNAEQQELAEMIESGVAENIAKKVIETNKLAKELNAERLKIKADKEAEVERTRKSAESEEFLKTFPNVKATDIPKEVFIEAEKSNLTTAYTKYENETLKKELEILKKNQTNKNSSPVKGTTEHGGVAIEKEDDFLKGFGL